MPKLTDKERLDIQFGRHKKAPAADGLPKASRIYRANYGPSSSYTPASDSLPRYEGDGLGAFPDPAGE